ncbi:hypothetical protein GYMLUDRAFT_42954 [Collybiopsis luxurians FD-317 M1]|uniref:Zn(2)-C6 fungal-type domain-containing protein n=1 Tax=Collybiopsis luxurians FD-317 M1 TaxID=944289 RepID=A0A0D0CYD8_9AGAR|nr:hypothetical protein GYMLUDRAFT_42954 [Collybiopsis luxurians FD-317 M1]
MSSALAASSSEATESTQSVIPRKSCAECRRLKLKCDRIFPCSACIRRGCGNLCPTGTLEKGKRGFLKRLEQALPPKSNGGDSRNGEPSGPTEVAMFISRDAAMTKRIQELEAALIEAGVEVPGAPMRSKKSSNSKSKSNKRVRERERTDDGEAGDNGSGNASDSSAGSKVNDVVVGFGTLTIDPRNRSRYVGLSSGSAYLDDDMWGSRVKEDRCSATIVEEQLKRDLENQVLARLNALPPYKEAIRLANNYFDNMAFIYEIVPKDTFFSTHLPALYRDSVEMLGTPILQDTVGLVGMILSLGRFMDLDQPCISVRGPAGELFRLAAFALNSHNVIHGGLRIHTVMGVQALHLMALYNLVVKDEQGAESNWQLIGLAVRSMQAQGLHMDGSAWNLPPRDLEERRRVFWEVFVYDRLQSFDVGRPHALHEAQFDCKMPTTCDDPLPSDSDASNSTWSFTQWHTYKFKWALLLGRIMNNVFSIKPPTYAAIMEYDRQINDFYFSLPQWILSSYVTCPIEPSLWKHLFPEGPDGKTQFDLYKDGGFKGMGKPESKKQILQSNALATMIFCTSLHLHRGPFCRALMMDPKKLLKSPYERSIARVVSSSTALINIARGMFVLWPSLTSRMWQWIFHTFTAAVCQAIFVIIAPFHPLAFHAFRSLRDALDFLNLADNRSARIAVERLSLLVEKATRSMAAFRQTAFSDWQSGTENSDRVIRGMPSGASNVSGIGEAGSASTQDIGSGMAHSASSSGLAGFSQSMPEEFLGASTKLVRLPEVFSSQRPQAQELEKTPPDSSVAFDDPFAQLVGLYNNSGSSNLNVEQTAYIQQQYASLPITSEAHAEMLPMLRSWIQGALPKEHTDGQVHLGGTSANFPYSNSSSSSSTTSVAPDRSSTLGDWRNPVGFTNTGEGGPSAMGHSSANDYQHDSGGMYVGGVEPHPHATTTTTTAHPPDGYTHHPGVLFEDVTEFNLSGFIQHGARAWTSEPHHGARY